MILLVPLTLIWKLNAGSDEPNQVKEDIVAFLAKQQFDVVKTEKINMVDGMPILQASRGACRMFVMRTNPHGRYRDMIADMFTATDRIVFVFRGKVYAEQPILLTALGYIWSRFLNDIGLARHITPVIALVVTEACDVDELPWHQLHESGVL